MENPTTYHALATRLHTLLEEESYSKTTMKDMEFILNSFIAYMIENDLGEYTPVLRDRLVEYCEMEFQVCPSRVTRTAEMLCGEIRHPLLIFQAISMRLWMPIFLIILRTGTNKPQFVTNNGFVAGF